MNKIRALLSDSHRILAQNRIPHALIGGFALSAHGNPRATNDIDYLVDGDFRDVTKDAFLRAGYTVFFESSEVLQMQGPGPVDFLFANRPLSKAMLVRDSGVDVLGVPCLDAADLIGLKIQAYKNNPKRELHELADIQSLAEKNPGLDWARVEQYARLFGEWDRVAKFRS